MFSRPLIRSTALRRIPRILHPSPTLSAFPRQPPASQVFLRKYAPPPPRPQPRIVHYRYDPRQQEQAKPLVTVEQISKAAQSRSFLFIVLFASGSAVVFYLSNLEMVPVSGRTRFNCYSQASVEKEGELMYRKIMEETRNAILPSWDPRTRMVDRVMERLIPASGLEHVNWEVHVINDPDIKNAFVIPGGKVFVFSGILPICRTDDGLATILGHEIAHNLANHAAESMSSMIMTVPIRWALIFLDSTGWTMGLGRLIGDFAMELGIARPASRKQESEADYIGLMMMAKSCYDPQQAMSVWQRMEAANKDQTPEWLSTHPSNAHRIVQIEKWLPEAEEVRNESGCAVTKGYTTEFQNAVGGFWRA